MLVTNYIDILKSTFKFPNFPNLPFSLSSLPPEPRFLNRVVAIDLSKMISIAFAPHLSPLPFRSSKLIISKTRQSQHAFKTRRTPRAVQKPDMPDSAKRAVAGGESVTYWQGEWICVDCGFVYKPTRRIKFEDLPATWKCPQCNAPKRRFAKKAGDFIAETALTSNTPIILFSLVGLFATIAFGVWASKNL